MILPTLCAKTIFAHLRSPEEAILDDKEQPSDDFALRRRVPCYAHATSFEDRILFCLLYTSPSPRDRQKSRMPSSA